VGIPLHDLLLKLRHRQVKRGLADKAQGIAFKGFQKTMKSPALYKISGKVGRVAQKPLTRGVPGGLVGSIPNPLGAWIKSRDLPPLARKSFRERWKEGI